MSALLLLAVALSAEPALIRLGADARAVLRVESAEKPAISASVGRVESLRQSGNGAWEAQYIPPEDALPQVAIVTAVAADEAAFIAIPLWGEGDAVVKTRPRGRISVEIGEQTFGPVVADDHGEAVVPVVVPPGVQEAHHGKRVIALHVPPSRTIHLALGRAVVEADRAQTVPVFVAAVTARGEPRPGASVRLAASRGELSALHEASKGLYVAWLALAPGRPGEARITAALDDAPQFVAAGSLPLRGGAARQIDISADRARIDADEPTARLHVSGRDAAGNPCGEDLSFEATAGDLVAKASAPGEWEVTLTLPPAFGGRESVEVRARSSQASASKTLPLVAGAPQTAAFERGSASVVADGASRLRLRVDLRDRYGNPVRGLRPELSAGEGSAELEEREGALYAAYRPPVLETRSGTTLALRAGSLEGRAQLTLLPNVKALAIGAKAGVLSNFSGFSAPLIGVEAALRTARFGPQLALSLGADYARRSQTELVASGAGQLAADSRLDLLVVHLSATWRQPFGDKNILSLGAGPCAGAYWTRVGLSGSPTRRGFAVVPGLQAIAGVERRFGWGTPFAEARAAWLTSPGLPMLTGPLRTISWLAGVRLEMR